MALPAAERCATTGDPPSTLLRPCSDAIVAGVCCRIDPVNCNVYVGNIAPDWQEEDIQEHFAGEPARGAQHARHACRVLFQASVVGDSTARCW